jgi:hypothetical protein
MLIELVIGFTPAVLFLAHTIYTFLKQRGIRMIECREQRSTATVEVDAIDAALFSPIGETYLPILNCSYWPERSDCKQTCVQQLSERCWFVRECCSGHCPA